MSHANPAPVADDAEGAEPIAIIGLSTRTPGASDAGQFWRNLVDGVESVRWFSREHQAAAGVPSADLDDPAYVSASPVLDDLEYFDAGFFGMNSKEAELCDPQQRLFLEGACAALADAGYDTTRYDGDIGVYGGTGPDVYRWLVLGRSANPNAGAAGLASSIGNSPDYLATLLSYKLNLKGPSFTLQSACSTSLVATHLACEALRNGECEMALAGGVCVELPHGHGYLYEEGGVTSADGHCRPFDAQASGTLWGSGAGVVLLKRLSDAVADGDNIRALILGSAVNNDGTDKVGFTAPSVQGQTEVIAQALAVAGVDPRTVGYLEAHGTGTALGDPIEVTALSAAYGADDENTGWCAIGSVKSNIGHLSQAAGVVGMAKAVLALENELIPPTLNFEQPNPGIDFESGPFHVATAMAKWPRGDAPRRAGVSSFGIGGTNAHLILQEAPALTRTRVERPAQLLQLSARTPAALATMAEQLADRLDGSSELNLADVAFTLRHGRRQYQHRATVVASDLADAAAGLRARRLATAEAADTPPPVAFLFPGQGAQRPGMGAELYRTEPVYAAAVDECAELLTDPLGLDLRELLLAGADDSEAEARLMQTELTQTALFTVEYALVALWRSWGVRPDAMIGHSIGEYVAATVAGVFTLPDALVLVAKRGKLVGSMPAGSMLAVQRGADEVADRLPGEVSIATVNGPGTCAVAGPDAAVEQFAESLRADGISAKKLRTSHAFHSPMMDGVVEEFAAAVASVPRHAPTVRFCANRTGTWITAEQATDPGYWADQLRGTVLFGECVATLLADGAPLLVECGPGRQLSGLARMQLPKGAAQPVQSLSVSSKAGDVATIAAAYGRLWAAGVAVDDTAFGGTGYRVPLPTYPYERTYHWPGPGNAETVADTATATAVAPAEPAGDLPLADWFSVPVWRQEIAAAGTTIGRCLTVVGGGAGDAVRDALRAAGTEVIEVRPGSSFANDGAGFRLRPDSLDDWQQLLAELSGSGGCPDRIVYALPAAHRAGALDADRLARAQDDGFYGLLALVQAMAAGQVTADIDVLTVGAQAVLGDDLVAPEYATIEGIVKVVGTELPAVRLRAVDLDPAGTPPERVVAALAAPGDRLLALRGARRYRQEFQSVPLDESESGPRDDAGLRAGGTYLITGGTGGVGISLAVDLGTRLGANLVLTARSGLPDRADWDAHLAEHGEAGRTGRAIAAIRRVEAAGGHVLVLAADVTDPADMARVRDEALARFGALHGVVHAAGLPGGGMAEVADRAQAARVLAPKLAGTIALRDAVADLPLDFVVLCSSVTSVIGGFGQVDYCAANAFLDAFAQSDGMPVRVLSVNWGGWSDVGMAAEAEVPTGLAELGQGRPVRHPVLSRLATGHDGSFVASGTISADRLWVLDEHRIDGVPVLPGTGHLENMRAALAAAVEPSDGQVVRLRDVVFLEPLSVAGEAELRLTLTGDEVDVTSEVDGVVRHHAHGVADWVRPQPAAQVDLDAIRRRCRMRSADEQIGEVDGDTGMLTFGPHWSVLRQTYVGVEEELGLIELAGSDDEPEGWVLHPALLDVATSFGDVGGGEQCLPLSYGSVLVHAPLPRRFYSHLRYQNRTGGTVVADVTLCDEAGVELVAVSDFVLRRVDVQAVSRTVNATPVQVRPGGQQGSIAPADGVAAFRRILATEVGSQVTVSVRSLDELRQRSDQANADAAADTGGSADTGSTPVAGRTEVESALLAIWREILDVADIDVDDDFFELGGNSLVAVQLIAQARRAVGVRLPMRTLFETPTVAGMAARIEQIRSDSAETPSQAPSEATPTIARLPRADS